MRIWSIVAVLFLTAAIIGCKSSPKSMRNLPPQDATWMTGRRTVADGTKLKMIFESDNQALNITRVDYKVYDGALYLWPIRGHEKFEPVEFTLDTAKLKLNEPWTSNVYWVGTVYWDNDLGRLLNPDPLGNRVDRVQADIAAN